MLFQEAWEGLQKTRIRPFGWSIFDTSSIFKLQEGLRTDNLTRAFIRDPEHNSPTALICQGAAVLAEVIQGEPTLSFLKFEAFTLWSIQPLLKLL